MMITNQIQNIYNAYGLNDYKLKGVEALLKVHGIDFKTVDGYEMLEDENKSIYEKFIIKIFNAFGLESRTTLIPKGIYYVEHSESLVKQNEKDDDYEVCAGTVKAIYKDGTSKTIHSWSDETYKYLEIKKIETQHYLRFEYEQQNRTKWLHVVKEGEEWY